MGEGFSLGRYGFNAYVLQQEVYASSRHDFYCSILQRYKDTKKSPLLQVILVLIVKLQIQVTLWKFL